MTDGITYEYGILRPAAKRLFELEAEKRKNREAAGEVYLDDGQVARLAEKILAMPGDWQDAFLLEYVSGFDTALTGDLLDAPDISDEIPFALDTLAAGMNVPAIARESIEKACNIAFSNMYGQVKREQRENPVTASKSLDKRIGRLIRKESRYRHAKINVILRRAAAVFLTLLMASSAAVLSVEALRKRFFDWLFSVFPTHTRVEFVDVEKSSDESRLNQYAPAYLPERFELVDTVDTDKVFKLYYANQEGKYIIFEVISIDEQDHININTEHSDIEEIIIDGSIYFYEDSNLAHIIFWGDGSYVFTVTCETTKEDAINIVKSTKLN